LQQRFAIALPQPPQTAIAPLQLPNSELLAAALRYRTPSTSQTAIAPPQLQTAIAPLQLPNSELLAAALRYRIPSTPQKRSHPSNSPNIFFNRTTETQRTQRKSHRIPSTSEYPFLMNHEEAKNTKEEKKRLKVLFVELYLI
jgi:hypothetical protein